MLKKCPAGRAGGRAAMSGDLTFKSGNAKTRLPEPPKKTNYFGRRR